MASFRVTPMSWEREKSEIPYTMPKFTALAAERICRVTISGGTPKTCPAVMVWMSSPLRKAEIMCSSPAMWASSRSSIWE